MAGKVLATDLLDGSADWRRREVQTEIRRIKNKFKKKEPWINEEPETGTMTQSLYYLFLKLQKIPVVLKCETFSHMKPSKIQGDDVIVIPHL